MNSSYLRFFLYFLFLGTFLFFAMGGAVSSRNFFLPNAQTSQPINNPELIGPDNLCIVFGSVIGDFFGAGDPTRDVYSWQIFGPSGQLLREFSGGSGFQTISYTFSLVGTHRVTLAVQRGGIPIYQSQKNVALVQGPILLLPPSLTICENQNLALSAIDPASNRFSDYQFTWRNSAGTVIGTTNSITITQQDNYSVEFFLGNTNGTQDCQTTLTTAVTTASNFSIESSQTSICPAQTITLTANPIAIGQWSYLKDGSTNRVALGSGSSIEIAADLDLEGSGDYQFFFTIPNTQNPSCILETTKSLAFFPRPEFEILSSSGASGCLAPDGSILIQAITAIDQIILDGTGLVFPGLAAGEVTTLGGLKSGGYSILAVLGNCTTSEAAIVPLFDPPQELLFDIDAIKPEVCTTNGKLDGSFQVTIQNGAVDGSYKVINEIGSIIKNEALGNQASFTIDIPGGTYFFELLDTDSCNLPKTEKIIIPALQQVVFEVPEALAICQSFELIPETTQALEFEITSPTGLTQLKMASEPIILDEAGEYTILGRINNQTEICPLEKRIEVSLVEPIDFVPRLIKEDCFGNRTLEAVLIDTKDPSEVIFTWFNENNEVVGNGQFLFPTSFGEFKLDVQPANSEACPIPAKSLLLPEPVLEVEVALTATQLCEFGPGAILTLAIDQPEAITTIEWRRFDEDGTVIDLPQFDNESEITVTESGTYEVSVFDIRPSIEKDCELGRSNIVLDVNPDKVGFDIPTSLTICESYEFSPTGGELLVFEVTDPAGTSIRYDPGVPIALTTSGQYSFLGYDPNLGVPLCPDFKQMEVTVVNKINFAPVFFEETCAGEKTYKAEIGNTNPNTALFSWFDESGNLIGTDQFLTLTSFGRFSLDVQPVGSIPCDQSPVNFEVEPPFLSQEVNLVADPFCPDADSALIVAETDFQNVAQTQWWFTDLNGLQNQLTAELDKQQINAQTEGTYEVRILNELGCLLGFDRVLLMRSMDANRPIVEDSYQVCPRYEIGPTINPGNFLTYEWYLEDQLVSTNPIYKPILPGSYSLIVESAEGCTYSAEFVTEEECELRVSYPNAIQPGNPDKEFLIYTNFLVDRLTVSIFNRWGEMIYFCERTDLISEESTCPWDGKYTGKAIPNGTYSIRIDLENFEKKITKIQNGFILVVE